MLMQLTDFPLLVFDWDGTLMDSEARIVSCLQSSIADLQLPERSVDEIRNIIGLGLHEAINCLYPDSDKVMHEHFTARYRLHFLGARHAPSLLFPGVVQTLQTLQARGHLLAVATGKGRLGLNAVLTETGCMDWFHSTRCADECSSKPHPQMLLEIMDELGVAARDTLMIGDTEYDLNMAHNAGAASIAVTCGVHTRERLLQCKPLTCLDTVRALPAWLAGAPRDAHTTHIA